MDLTLYCIKEGTDWQLTCAKQIITSLDKIFFTIGLILFLFLAVQIAFTYFTTKKKGSAFWFGVVVLDILLFVVYLLFIQYLPDIIVNLGIIK